MQKETNRKLCRQLSQQIASNQEQRLISKLQNEQ